MERIIPFLLPLFIFVPIMIGEFIILHIHRKDMKKIREEKEKEKKKRELSFSIVGSVHSNDKPCNIESTFSNLFKNLERNGLKLNINLSGYTD